jgi:hypothetical protein
MDAFSPRPNARLDYWFWKFHVDDLAFLVDLTVRRQTGLAEVRVSQWLRGIGRVVHTETPDWSATSDEVRIGGTSLRPGRCVGSAEDISWDLSWREGRVLSALRGLIARFEPFDTTLAIWPGAVFTGSVLVGHERFDLNELPGTFYHYWGRRLAECWVWLSATQFEGHSDRRVEGLFAARSKLYGRAPMPVPVSLLWTIDDGWREELVSGVNAVIQTRVTPTAVTVEARGILGARHRLVANWTDIEPNDLGEGIVQTMHADLTFDDLKAVPGTVGLEVRGYPNPLTAAPTEGVDRRVSRDRQGPRLLCGRHRLGFKRSVVSVLGGGSHE